MQAMMLNQIANTQQQLWQIATHLSTGMTRIWQREMQALGQANADFIGTLAQPAQPLDVAKANWQHGAQCLAELVQAMQARRQLLDDAVEDARQTLTGLEPGGPTVPAVAADILDQARDIGKSVQSDIEEVVDADLTRINGIGPVFADELRANGILSVAQIASLNLAEIAQPEHPLHSLHGHIEGGNWIKQAQKLLTPGLAA